MTNTNEAKMDTSKMRDQAREAFEKEWGFTDEEQGLHFIPEIDSWGCSIFSNSESCDRKNSAWYYFWKAWQTSREAVVVELPELRSVPDRDCWARTNGLGFNNALKESRQIIEAQGLKVTK